MTAKIYNIVIYPQIQKAHVGPFLSVGSLSVLTGGGPGLNTDRKTQGGEETPGSAKCHGWTALQGPGV